MVRARLPIYVMYVSKTVDMSMNGNGCRICNLKKKSSRPKAKKKLCRLGLLDQTNVISEVLGLRPTTLKGNTFLLRAFQIQTIFGHSRIPSL